MERKPKSLRDYFTFLAFEKLEFLRSSASE
jgi:hypothetical protein